jgi:Peptidase family M48
MKKLLTVFAVLHCFFAVAQNGFSAIDTSASASCRVHLEEEYTAKYKTFNKLLTAPTSAQRTFMKDMYGNAQEGFLEMIKENKFICDSSINPYLQGLMEEVLKKNGISPAGYRMLLSRDSSFNAFNTGDGTIVVFYGLFLMVDNEDELVFIISHEIGHQFLEHRNKWVKSLAETTTSEAVVKKTKEIKKKRYGRATLAQDYLKQMFYQKYEYRRRDEIQADSIGMVFFKKTLRNPQAAITVMQKMDTADEERDSLTVADYRTIFEKNGFKVKERWFEEEQSLFTQYDDGEQRINVDSLKTHPDCATRITLLQKHLDAGFSGGFTASKSFDEIKKNSTYQNLFNLYNAKEYGFSLYEALKVYKHTPEDPILKNIIYINLVKLREGRAAYTINRYIPKRDVEFTDSVNRFISFVNNIKLTDYDALITNFKL